MQFGPSRLKTTPATPAGVKEVRDIGDPYRRSKPLDDHDIMLYEKVTQKHMLYLLYLY